MPWRKIDLNICVFCLHHSDAKLVRPCALFSFFFLACRFIWVRSYFSLSKVNSFCCCCSCLYVFLRLSRLSLWYFFFFFLIVTRHLYNWGKSRITAKKSQWMCLFVPFFPRRVNILSMYIYQWVTFVSFFFSFSFLYWTSHKEKKKKKENKSRSIAFETRKEKDLWNLSFFELFIVVVSAKWCWIKRQMDVRKWYVLEIP